MNSRIVPTLMAVIAILLLLNLGLPLASATSINPNCSTGFPIIQKQNIIVAEHLSTETVYVCNTNTGKVVDIFTNPNFSNSMALSGNILVVGGDSATVNGYQFAGQAYVFNISSGNLITTLTTPNPRFNGIFGYSVAIDNQRIVVGAPDENTPTTSFAGNAYIFNLRGQLLGTLSSPNPTFTGFFGGSVAIKDKTVVIGAPNEGNNYIGRAYVFNAITSSLIRTISNPHPQKVGNFGEHVTIIHTTIFIQATSISTSRVVTYAFPLN
jgi:outer membrane protein assembly factor BamB